MEKIKFNGLGKKRHPAPEVKGKFIIPGPMNDGATASRWDRLVLKTRFIIPPYLFFMASLFAVQMLIFHGFRLIFFINNYQKFDPGSFKYLKLVLVYGFRFDAIVSCSIMLVPFILLTTDYFFEWNSRWFYKLIKIYLRVLLIISFLICAADIPFYAFFNSRLTTSAFLWKDNLGDMTRFILTDYTKYPYLLLVILVSVGFIYILVRMQGRLFNENLIRTRHSLRHKLSMALLSTVCMLIGIRGGVSTNALNIESLSYTNHYFINQLSWNPIISFFDSFDTFPLDYLDEQKAVSNAKRYLGGEEGYDSPIARKVSFATEPIKANVVLVLMESMSAVKMGLYGNQKNLTPNLDKLAKEGIHFNNVYSAGIHTCNGIYGTLFSIPSLMNEHPMNNLQSTHQEFTGFYSTLSQYNYQTAFICTNDVNFDNMGYFVRNNGCQYVYGMKDYPKNQIVNSWVPPDESLFNLSLEKINQISKSPNPFFATVVTITSHEPYTLPKKTAFKARSQNKIDQAYEYTDWSIGCFMDSCRKQPWFANTIFVFIADHGVNSNSLYEIPLSFHHTPLIIYAPEIIREPQIISKTGLQQDVFPTIMGMLKLPYVNNTFGVDLLHQERSYAYFSDDDKLGCLNNEYFLIVNKAGQRFLFQYRNNDPVDYANEKKSLADSMQTYAMSMLQTTRWMLMNKKMGPQYKLN